MILYTHSKTIIFKGVLKMKNTQLKELLNSCLEVEAPSQEIVNFYFKEVPRIIDTILNDITRSIDTVGIINELETTKNELIQYYNKFLKGINIEADPADIQSIEVKNIKRLVKMLIVKYL